MKPASFEYHDPTSLDEALGLMAQFGDQARPLAGGQSLVPLMNFRLLRPAHLIDLNGVKELNFLTVESGALRIGAITRQRQLERSTEVSAKWPLLRDAAALIGHVQIRNRGTVGGSLAHAFPSAELPVVMVTLGASFVLRSQSGQRTVGAEKFFISYMGTVLEPEELLVEVIVPPSAPNTGWAYQEVSRRYGDFALAGAAAVVTLNTRTRIDTARLTLTGTTPCRAIKAEQLLLGEQASETIFREAARLAIDGLEQDSDIHATGAYRLGACEVLARRALVEAAERAKGTAKGTSR